MLLQGEMAAGVGVLFVDVIDGLLVIHENLDVIALHDDVLRPPGVVGDQLFEYFDEVVETAGADRVRVSIVDLRLIPLGESGAERGAEIHAGVAAVIDPHVGLELAVHALFVHVEEVAGGPVARDRAILDGPGFRSFVGLPAVQRLAIEHRLPGVGGAGRKGGCNKDEDGSHQKSLPKG